jgi:hypothetical protein
VTNAAQAPVLPCRAAQRNVQVAIRWRSGPGFGRFWLDVDGILMDVYSILFPNICVINIVINIDKYIAILGFDPSPY